MSTRLLQKFTARFVRWRKRTDYQELLFQATMWYRIMYGGVRVVLSVFLWQLIGTPLSTVMYDIFGRSLRAGHPHLVYHTVNNVLDHHSFEVTHFLVLYLFFWGSVDIFLSLNLLRHKIWAFSVSIYVIGLFMLYEVFRFTHSHSLLLLSFIGVDTVILYLITREYKRWKK